MKAEILSVGSELTSGQNLDTNSQWLSRKLAEIGIPTGFHTTVADDLEDNVRCFQTALARAHLVIATGGLGPTQDDLTREALARVAGVDLVEDAGSLEHIRDMFAKRRRAMPERNRVQALHPRGAEPIFNAQGTAPGIWMDFKGKPFIAMPGVPSEMYAMFEQQVKPRLLASGLGGGVFIQRKINTFGTGESMVEEKLLDLTRRGHVPEVGITVSDASISLRILAHAATAAEAQAQIAPVEKTICERLGALVYGFDDEELHEVVVHLLKQKRMSIATAESITAGLVAHRIGQVPGASDWFRGGIIAYDNRWKISLLDVPAELIEEHGAVSKEVAEAMASGCRSRYGTDLAVSTTGLAGPGRANEDKPVGTVYVGVAWDGGVTSQHWSWLGTRQEIQSRTAKLALNLVRLHLTKQG
jgi:competence/damage-inducible protein CinA-like protein